MNELSIVLNGESFKLNKQVSITELFKVLDLSSKFMAVEINDEIIFRSSWDSHLINENDKVELVRAIGGGQLSKQSFKIAGKDYSSRLLVGTGKYKDEEIAVEAIKASGAEIVTVAVRRIELDSKKDLIAS